MSRYKDLFYLLSLSERPSKVTLTSRVGTWTSTGQDPGTTGRGSLRPFLTLPQSVFSDRCHRVVSPVTPVSNPTRTIKIHHRGGPKPMFSRTLIVQVNIRSTFWFKEILNLISDISFVRFLVNYHLCLTDHLRDTLDSVRSETSLSLDQRLRSRYRTAYSLKLLQVIEGRNTESKKGTFYLDRWTPIPIPTTTKHFVGRHRSCIIGKLSSIILELLFQYLIRPQIWVKR